MGRHQRSFPLLGSATTGIVNCLVALWSLDDPMMPRMTISAMDRSQGSTVGHRLREIPANYELAHSTWQPPPATIAVLKCSIAYLLASLFTFVPALATMLSTSSETDAHGRITWKPAYSAHMVATVVVYVRELETLP